MMLSLIDINTCLINRLCIFCAFYFSSFG